MKLASCEWRVVGHENKAITAGDSLLPVAIVHVVIQHLPSVRCCHGSSTPGNFVEIGPSGLNHFAVNHTNVGNEPWIEPWETSLDVPTDMEFADASRDRDVFWPLQHGVALYPTEKVRPILADDVVNQVEIGRALMPAKGLNQAIVHVHLPEACQLRQRPHLEMIYLSPF